MDNEKYLESDYLKPINLIPSNKQIIYEPKDKSQKVEGEVKFKKSILDYFKDFFKPQKQKVNTQQLVIEQTSNDNTIEKPITENKRTFKILTSKNAKVALVLLIFAVVAILILNISDSSINDKPTATNAQYYSTLEYARDLEEKLKNVLSSIKGAGAVSVMVWLNGSPEYDIATNVDEKTNTVETNNGTTINSQKESKPIVINQNGSNQYLILKETLPEIKGVIVVASGAEDINVKLNLLTAVQNLLGIPSNKIEVYAGI